MHITYFIPGPMSRRPGGREEVERRHEFLRTHAFPGTLVEIEEAPDGPASIESTVEEELAVPGILRALVDLDRGGADAVVLGCAGDPGLAAARELVGIPVVGPAQASAHLALQLCDRFGIITVVDEVVPTLRRRMRVYGLDRALASLTAVDVPVLELRERRDEVLDRISTEAEAAMRAGAEAIVLGCMSMGFLDVARDIQQRVGIPVVNPVLAALKFAESAVAVGVAPSNRAYPAPRKAPVLADTG